MLQRHTSQRLPKELRNMRGIVPLLEKFGSPTEVYTPTKIPLLAYALGPFCLLVGLLVSGAFVQFSHVLSTRWSWWDADFILFVGGVWTVTGLKLALAPLLKHRLRVAVCPKGFIYMRQKAEAIPWETISSFWKDIHIDAKGNTTYTYKVQCKNSAAFLFTQEIHSVQHLGQRIEREVVQQVLPQAVATYEKGSFVVFNEIAINTRGIWLMHEDIPLLWENIEHIGINQLVISIYKKGEYWDWATFPVSCIANVEVLKQLNAYVRKEHNTGPLRRLIAAYNTGQSLHFGTITLSRHGVNAGKSTLMWSEIGSIEVNEQAVVMKRRRLIVGQDEWEVFPLRTLTDAPLLQGLINYVLQEKPGVLKSPTREPTKSSLAKMRTLSRSYRAKYEREQV